MGKVPVTGPRRHLGMGIAIIVCLAATTPDAAEPLFRLNESIGSNPLNLTRTDRGIFFTADDGVAGREFWQIHRDGTVHLVADLMPGPDGSDPEFLVGHKDEVFFFATKRDQGGGRSRQLFVSRGAPHSTIPLSSLSTGLEVQEIVVTDWGVVFSAATPDTGLELWVTRRVGPDLQDWSPTELVPEFAPGMTDGVNIAPMFQHGNSVLFAAYHRGADIRMPVVWIWRENASLPEPFLDEKGMVIPCLGDFEAASSGDVLYFVSRGEETDLWMAEGDLASAEPLLPADASVAAPDQLATHNRNLFFSYQTPEHGRELFTINTETHKLVLLGDINPGPASSSPYQITPLDNRIVVNAFHAEYGIELWSVASDGNREVELLGDFVPGAIGSRPYELTRFSGRVYFSCAHPEHGEELWCTDGTQKGTRLVTDLYPGSASAEPYHLVVDGDRLLFTATAPEAGEEIWCLSNAEASLRQLTAIRPSIQSIRSSEITSLVAGTDRAFFITENADSGETLWSTDGTWENTVGLLKGVSRLTLPSHLDTEPESPVLQFVAQTEDGDRKTWQLHLETQKLALAPVPNSREVSRLHKDLMWNPNDLHMLDDELPDGTFGKVRDTNIFAGWTAELGRELWALRDSEHYPRLVMDIFPGPASGNPSNIIGSGDWVVFIANRPGTGSTMWITDGTTDGTKNVGIGIPERASTWRFGIAMMVRKPNGNRTVLTYSPDTDLLTTHLTEWQEENFDIRHLAVSNNKVYFIANHPSIGEELWCIDGLDINRTFPVRDLSLNQTPKSNSH